jgi:hypothetical protein
MGRRALASARNLTIAVVVLVLVGVAVLVFDLQGSDPEAGGIPLGFYAGSGAPGLVSAAAADTGTHPSLAEDFLQGSAGWTGLTDRGQINRILDPWRGKGYRLVLGVPIIPTSSGSPVGTLAEGANGSYNAHFRTLAQNLVAAGQGNAILRIGWEFNGNWETWSVLNPSDASNFADFFRQIVTTMRKVSPNFQYVWNLSDGSGTTSLFSRAYPGNNYVDYVGDDVYDGSCASNPTPQGAWKSFLTGTAGLDWVSRFAAAHGKPMAIPEWGIEGKENGSCSGLGDDPYFIKQMAQWLTTNHAGFSIYFDFDAGDGSHRLQDSAYSASLTAFRENF